MNIPVSFGEVVDKITILQLKVERINDATKRNIAAKELALLEDAFGTDRMVIVDSQAQLLRHVNGLLWTVEDALREMESQQAYASESFIKRAREVYFLNDKRAAIKRAVDGLLNSQIMEVKSYSSYKSGPVIIIGHQGMGDHIIMNGLVRYAALFHQTVSVVVLQQHVASVSYMYRDSPEIQIVPVIPIKDGINDVDNEKKTTHAISVVVSSFIDEGYLVLAVGNYTGDATWQTKGRDFAEAFYKQANVEYEMRWSHFFVVRDKKREHYMYDAAIQHLKTDQYVFLHDDPKRNMHIDLHHPVFSNDTINTTDMMIYHPNNPHTNPLCGQPDTIFDYCELIEKAKELHMMDSSFALLADALGYNRETYQKRVLHAYAKNGQGSPDTTTMYPFLYKTKWSFVDTRAKTIAWAATAATASTK